MSAQSYIDVLMRPDHYGFYPMAEGAIWEFRSCMPLGSTPGLSGIKPDEIRKLVSDTPTVVCIAGQKCLVLRDELHCAPIYLMDLKTMPDAEGNKYSICVGKCKTAVVIGKGKKGVTGGQVSNMVGILRSALCEIGL
ncbi:profilin-3-like [Parambassis ranga]|uniref:Profilin n=1 Tax=Parambassis ranga TaxID=210632 RepID=A0A6P7ID86_9TELE|nr:profilin-3-like [Parambassis ranga]